MHLQISLFSTTYYTYVSMFGLKTAKHESDNLEGFPAAVVNTLLGEAFQSRRFERTNKKTREIYEVLQKLNKSGSVCVPAYKTNSTRVIQIEYLKPVGLRSPVKGGRPQFLSKGDCPIWGFETFSWESENVFVSSRGKVCDTITCNVSNPIPKGINKKPQYNKQ